MYTSTDAVLESHIDRASSIHYHSQVILKRAQSLRSTDPVLKEEPQPLNVLTISHPLDELRGIRIWLLQNLFRTSRRRDV